MRDREGLALTRLARLLGVQDRYRDGAGQWRTAPRETVVSVVRSLGAPLDSARETAAAVRSVMEKRKSELLPPVVVAWGGRLPPAIGRLAAAGARATWMSENGREGRRPGEPIPTGAWTLDVSVRGRHARTTVLSAPPRMYRPVAAPEVGGFLPLYSLRTPAVAGVASFGDLASLGEVLEPAGVSLLATLPLLASFLDKPFDPSPYAPVSRMFWNELYLDPGGRGGRSGGDLLDFRRAMAVKRRLLEHAARRARASQSQWKDVRDFARANPEAEPYARFRAAVERWGADRAAWPRRGEAHIEPSSRDYHLFVQWLCERQLGAARDRLDRRGVGLYLDLPIGVHSAGFDPWRFPGSFAGGVSVGAPPDALFSGGQNWGFPPPHPEGARRDGYRYLRACLEAHLRFARVLRIDHAAGLHRLFWVPPGAETRDGVYVRYPADELYAVLSIASHRHRAVIVAENLGTVPREANAALKRRGVLTMYVGQFEARAEPAAAVPSPPNSALACLNTHDTPAFAAFWNGSDITLRKRLGLTGARDARRERRERARLIRALGRHFGTGPGRRGAREALRLWLEELAASPAAILLLNLEDLWLEERPQNVPGIAATDYPSFRRRASRSLADIAADRRLLAAVRAISRARPRRSLSSRAR